MGDKKLEALQATSLFSSCSAKELDVIGQVTERATIKSGTQVVREGSIPHQMAIIVSGSVEVSKGGEKLATLGAGDVVGELAMVDGQESSADVVALEDCDMWLIARSGFIPTWEKHPEMSTSLLQAVVKKLRATNELLT